MEKFTFECVDISQMDGFAVVTFATYSLDSTIYAAGNVGIQVFTSDGFVVGNYYNTKLELVVQ